jgi:hypothetical protein
MSSSTTWPPSKGVTTPTVPRKDAVLPIYASTTINAPASTVLDAVLQVGEYPKWNTFVPRAQIVKQPDSDAPESSSMRQGAIMNFDVVMDASKPTKYTPTGLLVTDICTPDAPTEYIDEEMRKDPTFTADLNQVYRVSWASHGGFVSMGLRSERFHEIIPTGDNQCEVRTWEVMGGVLAYTVKWMFSSTLQQKFKLWCDDLKKWCEEKHAAGATS